MSEEKKISKKRNTKKLIVHFDVSGVGSPTAKILQDALRLVGPDFKEFWINPTEGEAYYFDGMGKTLKVDLAPLVDYAEKDKVKATKITVHIDLNGFDTPPEIKDIEKKLKGVLPDVQEVWINPSESKAYYYSAGKDRPDYIDLAPLFA